MQRDFDNQWIIKQVRQSVGELSTMLLAWPEGANQPGLFVEDGELVCASVTDVLYLSLRAIYVKLDDGTYRRVPWRDVDRWYVRSRRIAKQSYPIVNIGTLDGARLEVVLPIPSDYLPDNLRAILDRCILELTPNGRKFKKSRPIRASVDSRPYGTFYLNYETWLMNRNRAEECEPGTDLLEVADACDAIFAARKLLPEKLAIMEGGLRHKNKLVWENTIDMFTSLEHNDFSVASSYLSLFASSHGGTRFAVLCCIEESTPSQIANDILIAGLSDRSGNIRWKAAERAHRLYLKNLIPYLEAARDREKVESVRENIVFWLALLRDGYLLKIDSDGAAHVTTSNGSGWGTHRFSTEIVQEKGIDTIVAECVEKENAIREDGRLSREKYLSLKEENRHFFATLAPQRHLENDKSVDLDSVDVQYDESNDLADAVTVRLVAADVKWHGVALGLLFAIPALIVQAFAWWTRAAGSVSQKLAQGAVTLILSMFVAGYVGALWKRLILDLSRDEIFDRIFFQSLVLAFIPTAVDMVISQAWRTDAVKTALIGFCMWMIYNAVLILVGRWMARR